MPSFKDIFGGDNGSAIISAGSGLIGGIGGLIQNSNRNVKKRMKYQYQLNEQAAQNDFQRQLELNQILNSQNRQNALDQTMLTVEGAKKAGVSVAGLLSNGAGSTVAASSPSVGSSGGASQAGYIPSKFDKFMEGISKASAILDYKIKDKQADLLQSQIDNTDSQTEGNNIDNSNKQSVYDVDIASKNAAIQAVYKDMSYKDQLILKESVSTESIDLQNQYRKAVMQFEIHRSEGEDKVVWQRAKNLEQQFEQSQKSFIPMLSRMYSEIRVNNEQAALHKQLQAVYAADAYGKELSNVAASQKVIMPDGKEVTVLQLGSLARANYDLMDIRLTDVREKLQRGELTKQEADIEARRIQNAIFQNQKMISDAQRKVEGNAAYQWFHHLNEEYNTLSSSVSNIVSAGTSIAPPTRTYKNVGGAVQTARDNLKQSIILPESYGR